MDERRQARDALSRRTLLTAGVGSAAALALAACSAAASGAVPATERAPSASASANGAPLIMLIRHAEKPAASGGPFGVQSDGSQDAESLTVAGWQRAGALVGLLDPRTSQGPVPVRAGLGRPTRLIAADPEKGSKRPAQTVTPLAARLGLTLETTWKKDDTAALAAALRTTTGCTLVAWEHELIPDILSHLGSIDPPPPAAWPGDRFDLVWCLSPADAGAWRFAQVPQLLLAGDLLATA